MSKIIDTDGSIGKTFAALEKELADTKRRLAEVTANCDLYVAYINNYGDQTGRCPNPECKAMLHRGYTCAECGTDPTNYKPKPKPSGVDAIAQKAPEEKPSKVVKHVVIGPAEDESPIIETPSVSMPLEGFNAMGKPVPFYRQQSAYEIAIQIGVNPTDAYTVVSIMSQKLERDKPFEAVNEARNFVDLTGAYRLMAELLTAVKS